MKVVLVANTDGHIEVWAQHPDEAHIPDPRDSTCSFPMGTFATLEIAHTELAQVKGIVMDLAPLIID